MGNSEPTLREDFEAWVVKLPYRCSIERFSEKEGARLPEPWSGQYTDPMTFIAWQAYQAAWTLSRCRLIDSWADRMPDGTATVHSHPSSPWRVESQQCNTTDHG